ncbi:MAG: DUF4159 domain-containing protein [Bryobacteraceae bacterium]|jgi:hypothetical protein
MKSFRDKAARMAGWKGLRRLGIGLALAGALGALQLPFRQYPSIERYDAVPLPPDWQDKAEWIFARLMYPNHPNALFGGGRRFGGYFDWRQGGTSWTQDYPRADRHFIQAVRRLTRVSARSVEQPVNPDDVEDFYNWPWLAAGEMGDWKLTDSQIKTLREYLLRGGFLALDDFWGPVEYGRFNETMSKVFPDRPVVDIPSSDPIFHAVYNLDDRYQILGKWAFERGGFGMSRRAAGTVAHWMGIYDDKRRLMVAISFNSDVGDSWEWADDPAYPEKYSALGIRLGVNYVAYSMTH